MVMRLIMLAVIAGGFVAWGAWQDIAVSEGATDEPIPIQLVELERGDVPATNWITMGEHFRAYWGAVFQYQESSRGGEMKDTDKVDYTYYPVLSMDHPYVTALAALEERYGTLSEAPDEEFPELTSVSLFVRTTEFKTVAAVPEGFAIEPGLTGMLVTEIQSLDEEEEELVRDVFPDIDLADVAILEEGREPASTESAYGRLTGGIAAILAGIGGGLRSLRKKQDGDPPTNDPGMPMGGPPPTSVDAANHPGPLYK